jgi:hypothetical protein
LFFRARFLSPARLRGTTNTCGKTINKRSGRVLIRTRDKQVGHAPASFWQLFSFGMGFADPIREFPSTRNVRRRLLEVTVNTRREFFTLIGGGAASLCLPDAAWCDVGVRSTCRQVTLADGRRLSYREFGHPDPVCTILFFHGMPASRMEAAYFQSTAFDARCRISAIDRPGVGLSTFKPNRQITDWPQDVQQFVSALGIREFSVLGYSTGGPYALACAKAMDQAALKSVAVLNGAVSLRASRGRRISDLF